MLVHDHYNNNLPSNFNDFFQYAADVHTIKTRYATSGQLYVHEINTELYGRNSIKYNSIQIWSFFTKHFSEIDLFDININQLKKIITEYYLNSYID